MSRLTGMHFEMVGRENNAPGDAAGVFEQVLI